MCVWMCVCEHMICWCMQYCVCVYMRKCCERVAGSVSELLFLCACRYSHRHVGCTRKCTRSACPCACVHAYSSACRNVRSHACMRAGNDYARVYVDESLLASVASHSSASLLAPLPHGHACAHGVSIRDASPLKPQDTLLEDGDLLQPDCSV